MNRSSKAARAAVAAMWVMIGVIVLGFFFSGPWIRITWAIAAAVCLICTIIVAYNKYRQKTQDYDVRETYQSVDRLKLLPFKRYCLTEEVCQRLQDIVEATCTFRFDTFVRELSKPIKLDVQRQFEICRGTRYRENSFYPPHALKIKGMDETTICVSTLWMSEVLVFIYFDGHSKRI